MRGRLVFLAPEWVNGSRTLLVVKPEVSMDVGLTTHLLVNAYNKDGTLPPITRWANDGLTRYIEKKQIPDCFGACWAPIAQESA